MNSYSNSNCNLTLSPTLHIIATCISMQHMCMSSPMCMPSPLLAQQEVMTLCSWSLISSHKALCPCAKPWAYHLSWHHCCCITVPRPILSRCCNMPWPYIYGSPSCLLVQGIVPLYHLAIVIGHPWSQGVAPWGQPWCHMHCVKGLTPSFFHFPLQSNVKSPLIKSPPSRFHFPSKSNV